ncbi:uncharacterized protein LOC113521529 [Galleria mellonella]|uniref:Uncharacterized protein LOC113521529 n=1 Tax=Galleria mellonella TaxID=7137 RepID=A0ABM3N5S2_GALME|nr:uncharacterized protein LOC113521529 [Galleria mellonella]
MFLKILYVFTVFLCVAHAKSVIVGHVYKQGSIHKVYEKTVETSGIPLIKKTEEVYFEYPLDDQMIKGVAVMDLDNGLAESSINSGGLGFNFVNITLKSERGLGLRFRIEVYA